MKRIAVVEMRGLGPRRLQGDVAEFEPAGDDEQEPAGAQRAGAAPIRPDVAGEPGEGQGV